MEGTCPRCGGATGDARWCPTCGKKLASGLTVPTPEAAEAARRETAWLEQQRAGAEAPPGAHVHAAMRADAPENPSGRAQVVRWLLYAQVLAALVTLILEAVYLSVLGDTEPGDWAGSKRVDDALIATGIAYIAQFLLLLVTAGFFIAWLHRVYKNARGLGAGELRFAEGWAIGGWFVPIMWWWRPKQIVNDTWRASDPKLPVYTDRGAWEGTPVPAIITAWWALWIVLGFLNRVASRLSLNADTLDEDRSATIVAMISEPVLIVTALLAVRVVTMITDRQNERAAERERTPAPA